MRQDIIFRVREEYEVASRKGRLFLQGRARFFPLGFLVTLVKSFQLKYFQLPKKLSTVTALFILVL